MGKREEEAKAQELTDEYFDGIEVSAAVRVLVYEVILWVVREEGLAE